jgi:MFS family permease
MLTALCIAEFLGMTLWFSATAVAPTLIMDFRLNAGQAAWLTMAVQAGFVGGTLFSALLNLPDVMNARWLFAVGCLAGSTANAAVVLVDEQAAVVVLRLATGIALAWVYPPGMKLAASWFEHKRGSALGFVVGALTVGSAFPHLLASLAVNVPWRTLMLAASGCAITGGVLVLAVVRDGPYVSMTAPFDPRAVGRVFSNRRVRLATLGYLGHMWELYAMWTWIAAFAAASVLAPHGSLVAFVAIASGAVGCVGAGFIADRIGKARIAACAMIVSAGCSATAGLAFEAPPWVLFSLAVVWGIAVVADSALFSALVTEHSSRDYVGTALTVQLCAGFLLTMVTIRMIPALASIVGWQWAFLLLVPGPLLGTLAMLRLTQDSTST